MVTVTAPVIGQLLAVCPCGWECETTDAPDLTPFIDAVELHTQRHRSIFGPVAAGLVGGAR